MGDIYFWRQFFILGTTMFTAMSFGYMVSFPSVLNPSLLSQNNTDIQATPQEVSWITASNGITGVFGFLLFAPILQILGRKAVHIISNAFILIGWVIFSFAQDTTALVAARICQGFAFGSLYIHTIILSEYTAPERRGYFMTIKQSAVAVGALICHSLSLVWSWRTIASFAISLAVIPIVLTPLWPESPFFLTMKGRMKASEKSFMWLHGPSKLRELEHLQLLQLRKEETLAAIPWYRLIITKCFFKPFVIACLLAFVFELCGKHVFVVYVIQMMTALVNDESLAMYFAIVADLFIIFALLCSTFFIQKFYRRTILFSFGFIAVALMILIYIVTVIKLPAMSWVPPTLIVVHGFLVNLGIIPVCYLITSEIFPLNFKGFASCLSGMVLSAYYALLLKFTPILIVNTGVGGLYAIYGVKLAVCLLVLYFIMPETKDKLLSEIENELDGFELPTVNEMELLQARG